MREPTEVDSLRLPGGAPLLRLGALVLPPSNGHLILPPRLRYTLGRGPGTVGYSYAEIEAPSSLSEAGKLFALFAPIGMDLAQLEAGWEIHYGLSPVQGPGWLVSALRPRDPRWSRTDHMVARVDWACWRVLGVGWYLSGPNHLHLRVPALHASDGTQQEAREHILPADGCGWVEVLPFDVRPHPFVETRPTLTTEHALLTEEVVWLVEEVVQDDVFGP